MGNPRFSVVLPTYNRPAQLLSCLSALGRIDYSRDRFEVIVVNDGGRLPAEADLAPLLDRIKLRVITQSNRGPSTARNVGATAATGAYLAFTDDDCEVTSGWLRAFDASLAAAPEALIGGHTVNALPRNVWAEASQMLIDYLYEYYNAVEARRVPLFTSNNIALPAERFRKLGGFDESFRFAAGEDRDLCDRWAGAGHAFVYAPAAVVHHFHALTSRRFARQHFGYGRGAFTFHARRAQRGNHRVRVEPFSFYTALLAYPFGRSAGWRAAVGSALMVAAQTANAAGFFWEQHAARRDPTNA